MGQQRSVVIMAPFVFKKTKQKTLRKTPVYAPSKRPISLSPIKISEEKKIEEKKK